MSQDTLISLELAGLKSETFNLSRPLSAEEFWVPVRRVKVVQTAETAEMVIAWEEDERSDVMGKTGATEIRPRGDRGVLEAFLALSDAPAERIRSFVERCGPLPYCPHGHPWGHLHRGAPDSQCTERIFPQPVEMYRGTAREMEAVLCLAAALSAGKEIDREDVAYLNAFLFPSQRRSRPERPWLRRRIAEYVNTWFLCSRLGLRVAWDGTEPHWQLASFHTAVDSVLARQLAAAVVRASLVFCRGCGSAFEPKRRPRGPVSYCLGCRGAGIDGRNRQRRRRARERNRAAEAGGAR